MNMKKISIIFLIFCGLILSMGMISAADNDTAVIKTTNQDILSQESTSTNTTVSQIDTPAITKTSVSTPDLGFVYKKNQYMKITVKDKTTNEPVSKLKIKVKLYTNKKYKTYTLKTDSSGVAKLSTKKLTLGSHKFVITSGNDNYNVSKKDSLFIGKKRTIDLKINKHKKLKSGDAITTILQKNNGQNTKGVYTEIWYAGAKTDINPHYTMILQAKLYFKNTNTGKIITKTTKGKLFTQNGEIYRSLPSTGLIKGYTPIKAKIWYLTSV